MSKTLQRENGISIGIIKLFVLVVISFFMKILPVSSQVRGPYLQSGTATSMVIRWRTDVANNSQVRYGTTLTQLTNVANNLVDTIEHEIKLSGLTPLTKYYYSIGNTTTVLQGDTANYFYTLPTSGATGLVRIGVLGDCGNNSTNQLQVRDQLKNYLGSNYMTSWILLGDNAYDNGTDAEYQANFFNFYKDKFLKQSPLYPSPGNHDYANNSTIQNTHNTPYYSVFTMPINGEAGGVASYNKAYYSFNVGNIHFLSLDSYGREDNATRLYDTLGKQVQWIKQDLAANTNKGWVVAYWHHPPYTMGNHNSDHEGELTSIRSNFIQILERMGVDLVLCGHSHDYERSRLLLGHYGYNNTFNPTIHNISNSTGTYDGSSNSCPYVKDSVTKQQGTVYVVSGSSGQLGGQQPTPQNAMFYSNSSNGGSIILEVQGNRLDAKWICADGIVRDKFTMMKNVNLHRDTTISAGNPITLTASFTGDYNWLPGNQTTKSITITPPQGITQYTVKDNFNCVTDSFKINALSILPLNWGTIKGWHLSNGLGNQIQWQTLTENNNRGFEVERSINGTLFTLIGKETATSNSNSPITYNFIDRNVDNKLPLFYYRIKQSDFNTSFTYSPVIVIKSDVLSSNIDVQIVPNPGQSNEIKVRLLGLNTITANLKLTDAVGHLLATRSVTLSSSLKSFMPDVPRGTYFLNITTEFGIITKQVIVK